MKFTFSISSSVWIVFACLMSFGDAQTMLTAPFGHFSSPNYPDSYGNDVDMSWMIKVKPNYRIKLEFSTFDLEDSYDNGASCIYDYVKLSLGAKTERLCGNRFYGAIDAPSPGQVFWTDGNNATVQFVSDYSNEGIDPRGFLAHYSEIDVDECANQREKELYTMEDWDELLTCDHFCNNVPGSYYCSCRAGYTLHSDKHTCIATFCEGNVYNTDIGEFQSPGYPGKYSKYADCSWHITVREGLEVNLFFAGDFAIEKHVDEGCVYDILKIEYGGKENLTCGTTLPEPIFTNARDVMITFTSDRSVEMGGFEIFYNTTRIRCLGELGDPEHGNKIDTPDVVRRGYYHFEDEVNFSCQTGYEFKPGVVSRLECLSDGSWSHPQPNCTIKVCGEPTDLMNVDNSEIVDFDTKQFVYGETITVKCHDWYKMIQGSADYICTDAKTWVSNSRIIAAGLPKCRPICGTRGEGPIAEEMVSHGTPVKNQFAFPWMAFIDKGGDHRAQSGGRKGEDYCGGTLVDEHTVVTAAHCVDAIDEGGSVTVWLGILDRYEDNFNYTQSFEVPYDNIILHESFRTKSHNLYKSFDYDVAVLKLLTPAELSNNVHPICLPGILQDKMIADSIRLGRRSVILGWGKTEHGNFSRHLMKARIEFVSHDECRDSYENVFGEGGRSIIADRVICASLTQDNGDQRDSCSGDSGGPLMTKYNDDKWYLNGIVSFGFNDKGCGKSPSHGGYTNVGQEEVAVFIDRGMEL